MSSISATSSASSTADYSGASQALNTEDFMKIMITELTNQDPFEPMKNQDLLNQMSTIQQLESSQSMTRSFETLMLHFDELLFREELGSASEMVGRFVSGVSTAGLPTSGKVVGVRFNDNDVMLELDTGELVKMTDVNRLAGQTTQDLIGQLVMGYTVDGNETVGIVGAVNVSDGQATLILEPKDGETAERIPVQDAFLLSEDNAHLLLNRYVKGYNGEDLVEGYVDSFNLSPEGITLILERDDIQYELPLLGLSEIKAAA